MTTTTDPAREAGIAARRQAKADAAFHAAAFLAPCECHHGEPRLRLEGDTAWVYLQHAVACPFTANLRQRLAEVGFELGVSA